MYFTNIILMFVFADSSTVKDQVLTSLQERVDILETKFQALTSQALKRLQQTSVRVDTFYAQVTCMKHTLRGLAGKYIRESLNKLGSSATLEMLWGELNFFWDFFNYELLQHVVRVMFTETDDPLLCQLAEYEDEIGRFLSSTKLCDFFEVWPFSTEKPQEKEIRELKRVVVKVNRKWKECTLHDVKNISSTFAQGFFLPHEFLLLAGVGKSSVSLLWYVTPSMASLIAEKPKEKNDFLSDNGFLSIIIDGHQVYPLTPMRQCSSCLKTMYEQYTACYEAKKSDKNLLMPFKLALITKQEIRSYSLDKYSLATLRGDKDDLMYKKSPTTISTLGTLPSGSPARLILLEGAPGSGKTTLSFDAVLKWMRNEILTDVSLLALFPLRDYNLKKATSLLQLLALITTEYESLMEELEANKGEGMVFWFDGWDEIASSLDGHSSIYEQLVTGKILPKARVVVTSRSWATDYIKKQLDQQPSQHIEIVSSYQDQIDWLLELKKQELAAKILSMISDFLQYLEETPAIRCNMHTPLATQITLEVYQWSQESGYQWSQESGSPLPTTVTQLYTSYTCLCIHKYLDNHSHFESKMWKTNNFRDLPEPLRSWLVSLCRLAFDGLVDGQRLVFPDVPNHLRLETLGLMQAQAPLYASEGSAVVSYHYKHLTLQEFLSALLLSWMSDEERSEIVERCVSDGRYTMTLRFLSGLTESSPILRDHMRRMLDCNIHSPLYEKLYSKEDRDMLTVLHWLFEGVDKATTADILGERKITVRSHYSWSALDYFVTGHCIARSNCSWDINFSYSHMGDEKMTQFLQALSSADGEQGDAHLNLLNWSVNELTSQSLCHLQHIPVHYLHHLKSLDLSWNNLDRTAVDHLSKTIPHMPQLEELTINYNPDIQRGGAVSLVSALCDHKALKSLGLRRTKFGEEDCEQLGQLLSSSQCLEELNVSNNSLSSDSVHILFKGLQQNSSLKKLYVLQSHISLEAMKTLSAYLQDKEMCKLEKLDLRHCDISSDTAVELAHGLSGNCSVKVLYLSRNPIGDGGAAALGQAMTENKTITELTLASCDITTSGGAALASLMANSTIEELDISGNSLGGAIPSIAQALEDNKTLKRLYMNNDDSLSQSNVENLINSLANNTTLEVPEKFRVDTDKRVTA